ncbi:MAG: hypothetical protein WD767_04120 [Alphaproteobacteria bacterium]
MRGAALFALLLLTACGSPDETRLWAPGEAVVLPPPTVVPEPPPLTAPPPVKPLPPPPLPLQRPSRPYYEPPDHEPSVQSRGRLTDSEARALRGVRQSIDSSINELERRARFGDTTAAEDRELRTLKARQRDVLRRLRGS